MINVLMFVAPITESGKYAAAYFVASILVYGGVAFICFTILRWIKNIFWRSS